MDALNLVSPPEWHHVLVAARRRRDAELLGWLQRLATLRPPARWIGLGAMAVACTAAGAGHDRHIALVMAAIAVASLVSSIAGFAFSAICGAMLFHLSDDPVQVVQVMVTCSIANQAAMTWAGAARYRLAGTGDLSRRRGDRAGRRRLAAAAHRPRALCPCAWSVPAGLRALHAAAQAAGHPPAACGAGLRHRLLGGITGGAAGFPGAFVTIWCSMKGWDKARQRAIVPAVHPDHAGSGPDDHQPGASAQLGGVLASTRPTCCSFRHRCSALRSASRCISGCPTASLPGRSIFC